MWNEAIPTVEDCVEYFVYPLDDTLSTSDGLVKLCDTCNAFAASLFKDHLWQVEPFRLVAIPSRDHDQKPNAKDSDQTPNAKDAASPTDDLPSTTASSTASAASPHRAAKPSSSSSNSSNSSYSFLPHLYGATRFGDNVEDEWALAHVLHALSRHVPALLIAMRDSDGEFLLIEASLDIPKWLTPDNSGNRVWLKDGKFHIIPKPRTPMELMLLPSDNNIPLERAIDIIKRTVVETKVNEAIQLTLEKRMSSGYSIFTSSTHIAYCLLPRSLAYLIAEFPPLVSAVVRSYYYRDKIQIRSCRTLSACVDADTLHHVPVRFTRLLYAQILRQPIELVPVGLKPFGFILIARLPPQQDVQSYKRVSLGYKLICGFEIFCRELKSKAERETRQRTKLNSGIEIPVSIPSGNAFSELFHSHLANQRTDRCAEVYSGLTQLLASLKVLEFDPSSLEYKLDESGAKSRVEPSSDEWLNLSPQEVDDLIAQKQSEMDAYLARKKEKRSEKGKDNSAESDAGSKGAKRGEGSENDSVTESSDENDDGNANGANPMDRLASTVKQFIQNTSSYEGVHSRDEATKERGKVKTGGFGFDDSSSEDESDEFYKMGDSDEDSEEMDEEMVKLMKMMDKDLEASCLGESFELGDGDSETGVDVDFNMIKNFLSSYSEQHGNAGPVSNLFSHLNLNGALDRTEKSTKKKEKKRAS